MTPTPPNGSQMSVRADGGDTVIVIPNQHSRLGRYGAGLFLLFWLGGWTVGLAVVGKQTLSGLVSGHVDIFTMFWLSGATVAEIFVIYFLFRIFRPPVPESLTLKRSGVTYDPGIPPLQSDYRYTNQKDAWKAMFPKRTIVEIDRRQLASLRLRETDSGNRLTVDANASRLDLALNGSEIDREWLYQLLANRYELANPSLARS
jgi:hypothetical protein